MTFNQYISNLKTRAIVGLKCELCGKRAYHDPRCAGIGKATSKITTVVLPTMGAAR